MNALITLMIKNRMMDNHNNTQKKLTDMNMKVYVKQTNNFNAKSEKRMQNKHNKKRYAAGTPRFRYNSQGRSLRW